MTPISTLANLGVSLLGAGGAMTIEHRVSWSYWTLRGRGLLVHPAVLGLGTACPVRTSYPDTGLVGWLHSCSTYHIYVSNATVTASAKKPKQRYHTSTNGHHK